jgi:lysophospholipase L1-like esterase
MKTILCYGDSNTWGWIPTSPVSPGRYSKEERWSGVLQQQIGDEYEIIEEGLNGRTTVWYDPVEEIMSGKDYLMPCLTSHMPLDLVILMLGTNDLKYRFSVPAFDIAEAAGLLVRMIQKSEVGPGGDAPQILMLAPPPLGKLTELDEMFTGGKQKSMQLGQHYQRVADMLGCYFLNTADVIASSDIDGVHLEADAHKKLGIRVAQAVREIYALQKDPFDLQRPP